MRRSYLLAGSAALGLSAVLISACNWSSVIGGGGGSGGAGQSVAQSSSAITSGPQSSSGSGGPLAKVDKVDIVLGIDNSRSMADKQQILSLALSDLVGTLANPPCIDQNQMLAPMQPASPLDPCPAGYQREFAPIMDIHVGIVTTSLGGHGSDACQVTGDNSCGNGMNPSNNDAAHLVSRLDACGGATVPTYGNKGFLAWDPAQKLMPPGESDLTALGVNLKTMVLGAGQIGCGYESQMESWYRFLIDPEPYQSISVVNGAATPMGIDNALLQQRAEFLRPDSLLAILMLSDEDDCSIKEYGQFFYAAQQRNPSNPKQVFHLPRARAECAVNPNDPCCKSCGQPAGACPPDPTCSASPTLSDLEDDISLRCWDNKRRFGIDLLYPSDRYIQGLTSAVVPNRNGDLVPNPIYSDLNPNDNDSTIRDPGLVVVAGIVGVPWQDIARDPADLTKGFKDANELSAKDNNGDSTWDKILGDPANYVPPKDPHMIESDAPRPPLAVNTPDPINGHEYTIAKHDDLEYACVFDLPSSRDCLSPANASCDCGDPMNDNPLCDTMTKTTQIKAKAYPGRRQLNVLKGLGAQGVVASICPSQASDPNKLDYAYRPAVSALIERVKTRLKTP